MTTSNNDGFGKAICSICYEDLKPIVEDLQSISICGHVFHELCLQQWFEYSVNAKKHTCPVCKQKCTEKNVGRLYFQSIGDQNDCSNSSQILNEADAGVLRNEAKRLESKVSGLNTLLERQVNEIKELTHELSTCKEHMKKETIMKSEALRQKASIQKLLQSKSEELVKLFSECSNLREKNLELGKELAALKLITDLNLDEDDVEKFASLGRGNNKDTIDVLRKSLVIRNKSYKELMAKCNLLGRGEARYSKKLEKATNKINKLKIRIQELETATEANDNNTLRALKTSTKADHMDLPFTPISNLDRVESLKNHPSCYRKSEDIKYVINRDPNFMNKSLRSDAINEEKSTLPKSEPISDINESLKQEAGNIIGPSSSKTGIGSDHCTSAADMEQDYILLSDEDGEDNDHERINISQKFPSPVPTAKPGNVCFAGGLLGPDGATRYLGKWCKRAQASTPSSGDFIAVGADGRGGTTKVLRTLNQQDAKGTSSSSKRCKYGSKTSSLPSRGNFQIEHFFGKLLLIYYPYGYYSALFWDKQ
ncbi:hypothetical protein ACFE04_017949 [Oxalis oulophora]